MLDLSLNTGDITPNGDNLPDFDPAERVSMRMIADGSRMGVK